jgi:glycosyltransferase involved in cell wall biosynthesis
MRALIVSQRFPPDRLAGSEIQAQLLARELRRLGHEPHILTTIQNNGAPPETMGVPADVIPVLSGPLRIPSQWLATKRHLAGSTRQFDIVHCHCVSPTCLAALQIFRGRGTPVLLQPSLGGRGGEIDRVNLPLIGSMLRRLVASAHGYAVLDDNIHSELLAIGVDEERMHWTLNGVDLDQFRPVEAQQRADLRRDLGLPSGDIVLFVGQLVDRKGVMDLLNAWPAVKAKNPDATLVFVGAGPLETRVRQACNGEPSIRLLGRREDVSRIMQAADVFACPSHSESFGCVLTEAMGCGLPVVTCDTGVATVLPIHEEAGYIVDAKETQALQTSLNALLADPALRASMSRKATALAAPYAMAATAEHIVSIYQSMLA